jgi:hypothetical protein
MKRLVCTLILLLSATALCQDTAPVKSQETKEHYKGMTFITFKTEDSGGIVIPSEDTKRQLDGDNNALSL